MHSGCAAWLPVSGRIQDGTGRVHLHARKESYAPHAVVGRRAQLPTGRASWVQQHGTFASPARRTSTPVKHAAGSGSSQVCTLMPVLLVQGSQTSAVTCAGRGPCGDTSAQKGRQSALDVRAAFPS